MENVFVELIKNVFVELIKVLSGAAAIAGSVSFLRFHILPKLPRVTYPLIAYALAWGLEYGQALVTGTAGDPYRASLWMVLAGHVREWVTTLQDHGVSGK